MFKLRLLRLQGILIKGRSFTKNCTNFRNVIGNETSFEKLMWPKANVAYVICNAISGKSKPRVLIVITPKTSEFTQQIII